MPKTLTATVVTVLVLVPAVAIGGVNPIAALDGGAEQAASTSDDRISSAQSQYGDKVTICHFSSGNDRGRTLTLSQEGADNHLKNHPDDYAGPCDSVDDPNCRRARTVKFKLNRVSGTRIVRVEVFVNGKRKLVRKGRDVKSVTLAKLKRTGKLGVRVVAFHNTGSKVISSRSWKGCKRGKPKVRRVPRPS
jgi:hypothetical protein